MTTENLIIDGVDHAKFDLEWAKRGGVFVALYLPTMDSLYYTIVQQRVVHIKSKNAIEVWSSDTPVIEVVTDLEKHPEFIVRMATPDECKAAWIEYIEYHGWRPIESAPTGEVILAYVPHTAGGYVAPVLLQAGTFNNVVSTTYDKEHPTHWMPLPTTPKDE